jgi:arsenite-transporting ATPase
MERIFPIGRTVTRVVRPLATRLTSLPMPSEAVFRSTVDFYERLGSVRSLLTDADRASVRLVVNPERLVVAEGRRTATYLSLYGYRVDAVIANRLLPTSVQDPWFEAWKATQAEHLESICSGFAPVPVLRCDLAADEVVGVDALVTFGDRLYGDLDPASVLHHDEPLRVERDGDGYVLRLALPFAERDDLELTRKGGEIHVRVGPYRRSLVLPDALRRRPVDAAALIGGALEVRFGAVGAAECATVTA